MPPKCCTPHCNGSSQWEGSRKIDDHCVTCRAALSMTVEHAEEEWSYPQMEANWRADRNVWVEVSESFYWQALEVLPPILFRGARFMVGEPFDHDARGVAIHAGFVKLGERYFARYFPTDHFIRGAWLLREHLEQHAVHS